MNARHSKIFYTVQDYLMILCGTLLYGFGFNAFILSNGIVTGGLSGICALIFFATGGLIPVSVSYFVINVALLVVALKILGIKFLLKTIFGVFALSGSLSFFEWLFQGEPLLHDQPFMSIIIGGILCGTGLGLVFSAVITAIVVSFMGIIGFIGLIAPHIVKRLIGDDFRYLLTGSMLMGALVLLLSNIVGSYAFGMSVPVGIITSFIGGPVFIYILIRGYRRRSTV